MSFKRGFYKSISNLALYTYMSQGVEFFSTVILSRILLPAEYGFVAIINLFAGFIQLFANAGIHQSLIRSNYGYTFHRYLFNLSVWIGLALTGVLALLAYPVSLLYEDPKLLFPTLLMSTRFVFDSINYVPTATLAKHLKFNKIGQSKFSATVFSIGLSIVLAYLGFSYWALVIPMVLSPFVQFGVLYYQTRFGIKIYSFKAAKFAYKKISGLMGNLIVNNTISYWGKNVDKMVIGKFFSQADLGIYNRAFRFVDITFRLIIGIFNAVLFPSLKKLQEKGGDTNKEYNDLMGLISLINFPLAIILIAIPEQTVMLLWGEKWLEVAFYMPFVGIIILFQSVIATMTNVFILYKKEGTMTIITMINAVISAVSIIVGSFFSMKGIIIAFTSAFIGVITPIYIYYGYYKAFNFTVKLILTFWVPKVALSIILLSLIILEKHELTYITLGVFALHLIINQRASIASIFGYLKNLLSRGK